MKQNVKKKLQVLGYAAVFAACAYALFVQHSHAYIDKGTYTYIHNEAEYSMDLPDAPTGTTIWADRREPIPYLEDPPKFGSLGEVARIRRADLDTGDAYNLEITFLKSERDFLLSMTKAKMLKALEELYKDARLENKQENFSSGSDTLKWATITGFAVDENNNLLFNAAHYLTGLQTITVIRVSYNVENKTFQRWYDEMQKSIKYTGLK